MNNHAVLNTFRNKSVLFRDSVDVWSHEEGMISPATKENILEAMIHVDGIEAVGSTNINDALVKAVTIINHVRQRNVIKNIQPMIIFLTDGHPTTGETSKWRYIFIECNIRDFSSQLLLVYSFIVFGNAVL